MGQRGVLRTGQGGRLFFHCPGCDMAHAVTVGEGAGPRWGFNGDYERPTFSPSVLVTYPWGDPPVEKRCHSFVREGRIEFLSDCTHNLAGQTVALEPDRDD